MSGPHTSERDTTSTGTAPPRRDEEPLEEGEEAPPPGVRTMAVLRWGLVALMAVAAAASVAYTFGLSGRLAGGPSSGARYICPMHPSVAQAQPGECPICMMSLVPVDATGRSGAGAGAVPREGDRHEPTAARGVPGLVAVDLAPERIQLLGMRTARAVRGPLAPEIRTVGFVTVREQGLARVHPRFSGWIEALAVSQTGQRVTRGQVLATVYSPELLTAQQELVSALAWSREPGRAGAGEHSIGPGLLADARRRLELLGISPQEIDEIERAGKTVRAIPIRSPRDGHVTRKNALPGLYVEPGTELFEIADLATVWVLADLYEQEVARVKVGQKARLRLAAYADQTFSGRVQFIYPTVDTQTRTLRARLELRNPGLKLRPGMYGDVHIEIDRAEGLLVPAEAIVDTGEQAYVFVAREGGRFEPRRVRLGVRADDRVEVLEGLDDGETVVTTGNFLIDSESRLRAAIEGATAEGAPARAPASGGGEGPSCEIDFDKRKHPDKYRQCRACEVQHRGMGAMEGDCKRAIPGPWE